MQSPCPLGALNIQSWSLLSSGQRCAGSFVTYWVSGRWSGDAAFAFPGARFGVAPLHPATPCHRRQLPAPLLCARLPARIHLRPPPPKSAGRGCSRAFEPTARAHRPVKGRSEHPAGMWGHACADAPLCLSVRLSRPGSEPRAATPGVAWSPRPRRLRPMWVSLSAAARFCCCPARPSSLPRAPPVASICAPSPVICPPPPVPPQHFSSFTAGWRDARRPKLRFKRRSRFFLGGGVCFGKHKIDAPARWGARVGEGASAPGLNRARWASLATSWNC